jgi:hypothetical protein
MSPAEQLKSVYQQHRQEQVFHFFDQLNASQQDSLIEQLKQIDPERVQAIFRKATSEAKQREAGGNITV